MLYHEREQKRFLVDEFEKIDNLTILKVPHEYESIANLSIVSTKFSVSEFANRLDEFGFLTRASLHCNPSTHKFYDTFPHGALRISTGFFTQLSELEKLVVTIKRVLK